MKKQLHFGALALALLIGCGEGEDRQTKYLERAQNYLAEENYDKARVDARNVLQINPKNNAARLVLADIAFKEGNIRKAYGGYQGVIAEEPENMHAHTSLAKLFLAVKGFDQSLEQTEIVLAKQPDNAEVMGYKAVALAGNERLDEARVVAEAALAIDAGSAAALGVMSQIYINAGEPEKAVKLLQQGAKANLEDARINMMKVAVFEKMGNTEGLEHELQMLVNKYPESLPYSNALAGHYVRESRLAEAEAVVRGYAENNADSIKAKQRVISYLQQHDSQQAAINQAETYIKEESEPSAYYISLAKLHMFTGEKEQALEVLTQLIDGDPRGVASIDARNMIVKMHLVDKNLEAAKKVVAEILDIEPENAEGLFVQAGLNLAENNLKAGIADLRVVLKNDPENVRALTGLVRALEANGNDELALDNYKKLIALQTPDVKILASAARLAIKTEQYQSAEKFVRLALELDGENPGLVTNLIRLLVLKEDWEAASGFAKRLVDSEDSKALGYYLQAGLNMRLEEHESAIKNLKLSLASQPNAVESLSSLAGLLTEQQGADAALKYVKVHCEKHSEQAHCRYILGSLLAQNKQFDKAITELEKSLVLNKNLIPSYRQLAKVYAAKRDMVGVERVIQQGIDATGNSGLSFDLAGLYYGSARYEKAVDAYLSIIKAQSGDKTLPAKNNLAMIYAENIGTPESLKQAKALIADLQDSENPAYLDTVGWVMYFAGDYQQAVTYLRAAVEKSGSSSLLQYHLGMAYYKNGDAENAKKHLLLATPNDAVNYPGLDIAKTTLAELQ